MTNSGEYTDFRGVTEDDMKVFNEAMEGITDVEYIPYEVATQIVNGINYRFKCKLKVAPGAQEKEVMVVIYKPIMGKAEIRDIIPAN